MALRVEDLTPGRRVRVVVTSTHPARRVRRQEFTGDVVRVNAVSVTVAAPPPAPRAQARFPRPGARVDRYVDGTEDVVTATYEDAP